MPGRNPSRAAPNTGKRKSAPTPVIRLYRMCAYAVRRPGKDAPIEAIPAVIVVPISIPITSAAACPNSMAPAAIAASAVATPALEDWVRSVNITPIPTN